MNETTPKLPMNSGSTGPETASARTELQFKPTEPDIVRFWKYVQRADHGCWMWSGCKDGRGYGRLSMLTDRGRKGAKAHRVSWIIHRGLIPSSHPHVLHSCDNPSCVRPDHLSCGTHRDNMDDMVRKGRAKVRTKIRIGEQNGGGGKLKEHQVSEIKSQLAIGKGVVALAREFGVSHKLIGMIRDGRSWRHVL